MVRTISDCQPTYDGQSCPHLEIAREHKLAFAMIPDPDRRIARQYGVNCWPTIVSINENGLVDFVHSGITHKREATPDHSRPSEE
jgi:hypothetical protein